VTYVITPGCCSDASCIAVCPVQCIRPRPGDPDFTTAEQLYVDPDTCIDCGACADECPVDAVTADFELDEIDAPFLELNAAYFAERPIEEESEPERRVPKLPVERPVLRVAVVGTGPAACYAAAELADVKGVEVTVLEKLPVPFGLVRFGVAPDHGSTKLIADRFRSTLSRSNVTALMNIEVGTDVSVEMLLEHHHAVIWAAGAAEDRPLDIPGIDLPGSYAAGEIVNWYNGHPDHTSLELDLSTDRVVVIGNGNVALDVARVLASPGEAYAKTDIADHALEALSSSAVREVVVVGRRGLEHAACSTSTAVRTLTDGSSTRSSGRPPSASPTQRSVWSPCASP
jgi:ferredoxin--NADP+ reductase